MWRVKEDGEGKEEETDSRMRESPAVFSQSEKFSELNVAVAGERSRGKSLGEKMEEFIGPTSTREAWSTGSQRDGRGLD